MATHDAREEHTVHHVTVYPRYRDEVTGREWNGGPKEIELVSVTDGPIHVVHSMSGESGPMAEIDGPGSVRQVWAPFAWIGLACQLVARAFDAFVGLRERRAGIADLERRMVETERRMREEAESLMVREQLLQPPRPESGMSYVITTASSHRMPVHVLPRHEHADRGPGEVQWARDMTRYDAVDALQWQTSTHAPPAPLVLSDEMNIPCAPDEPRPLRVRRHIRTGEPE